VKPVVLGVAARFGDRRNLDTRSMVPAVFYRDGKLYAVRGDGAVVAFTGEGIGTEPVNRLTEGPIDRTRLMRAAFVGRPGLAAVPDGPAVSVRTLDGRERFRVTGGDSPVREVGLSADGRVLLVCRESARAEVFRLE
jgi:hypothetical protein